ncbi:Uncharacterised protein [Mycobacterium tuberculosis]|nr:Uncharacterised protein [Mycobacterium tuberculosis]
MLPDSVSNQDITTSHGSSYHKGSCFDTVLDYIVSRTMKFLNTSNGYSLCTSTFDLGSHFIKENG